MIKKASALCFFQGISFIAAFLPLLASAQVGNAAARNFGELPEEIIVTEQLSLYQIREILFDAEENMYDLFNELNDERRFKITCKSVGRVNSHISRRECLPRYHRDATRIEGIDYLQVFRSQLRTPENPGDALPGNVSMGYGQLAQFSIDTQHEEFKNKMETLAENNPEFLDALIHYVDLKESYGSARQKDD